jgi:hypothetical protein
MRVNHPQDVCGSAAAAPAIITRNAPVPTPEEYLSLNSVYSVPRKNASNQLSYISVLATKLRSTLNECFPKASFGSEPGLVSCEDLKSFLGTKAKKPAFPLRMIELAHDVFLKEVR